ncbi:MAG: anaerobic ribonucleoside-triphosphate reductase activating protein [Kiritimatiellales bacterium]|nr:anaerobic ribonucleoside-triphosphate reductase activating protein [Kiritimatiellales bacterium]
MPKETSIYAYLEKPSMVDYPQHYAAVFFVSGCGFTCGFCHNAALMADKQSGLSLEQLDAVCAAFRKEWVNGVVITGGEPTGAEDLPDLLRFFKEHLGFAVKLDTNGSNPAMLGKCLPWVDYIAMDIKCGLPSYPEVVGFSETDRIQESIDLIRDEAKDYEFRTTVISTIHTDDQMETVRQIVHGSKRYVLQAFIPREELPQEEFRNVPRTTSARLHELRACLADCADEVLVRGA